MTVDRRRTGRRQSGCLGSALRPFSHDPSFKASIIRDAAVRSDEPPCFSVSLGAGNCFDKPLRRNQPAQSVGVLIGGSSLVAGKSPWAFGWEKLCQRAFRAWCAYSCGCIAHLGLGLTTVTAEMHASWRIRPFGTLVAFLLSTPVLSKER